MSPPLPRLPSLHIKIVLVQGRKGGSPPFPGSSRSDDVQEQIRPLPYAAQSPTPITLGEQPVIGPDRVLRYSLVVHLLIYVVRSMQTNAWGTRAIEFAIGTGYVLTIASLLVLVKRRRLVNNAFRPWVARQLELEPLRRSYPGAERELFIALVHCLSASIAGVGYHVRSLIIDGPPENPVYLMIVSWAIVPNLVVVVMFFT